MQVRKTQGARKKKAHLNTDRYRSRKQAGERRRRTEPGFPTETFRKQGSTGKRGGKTLTTMKKKNHALALCGEKKRRALAALWGKI